MLDFEPVTLDKRGMMEGYFLAWGEHSCEHSFVTSFGTQGKYGDQVFERDGFLYILRSKRCRLGERVYLFPQGDPSDRAALREAVANILNDAHEHGALVNFEALTRRAADLLLDLYPEQFSVAENRDYAEYVHGASKLANFSGRELASRRYDVRTFYRNYGDRARILPIDRSHIDLLHEFQGRWLDMEMHKEHAPQLQGEDVAVRRWLDHFFELGLSGIILFIDDRVRGYAFGAPLGGDYYDELVEKGDKDIPDIYCVLLRELVRVCCAGFDWINREEDLGIPGLRKAKMSYRPDFMIEKFTARERRQDGDEQEMNRQ